ncbi:signal peptidase I [Candidatus Gottesmanbacteria bacterium]|nr:signal peptidase I [Candidatus Gottesmanbacteria bacterium]
MYPTFPKGKGKTNLERESEIVGSHSTIRYPDGIVLFGKRYGGYHLERGDIVFFSNAKTEEIVAKESSGSSVINSGFVKRVIALPGDKIEIRDGFVKLNDKIITEPYIAKARSTYGGNFLGDCEAFIIPKEHVFVMGDNRKGSNDSRFDLGLIKTTDIHTLIPITKQEDLKNHWRDTSSDMKNANQPIFSSDEYLALLNSKRREAGVKPLVFQSKLALSSQKRAEVIVKFNDLSFEATKSGYTMKKAMSDVGYSNIVWGEVPTLGYYEADELIENFWQFPDAKNFLLNPDFQETGIAASIGQINGCPVQIVVAHLAGYKPPNYSVKIISGWETVLQNLNEVIPSWEKAKGNNNINQEVLKKLLELLNERRENVAKILERVKSNQWLTQEEENMVRSDESLYQQITDLANKLNRS